MRDYIRMNTNSGFYANITREHNQIANMQEAFVTCSEEYRPKYKTYLTLALGPDIINSKDVFDDLIGNCISYPVDGFYFVLNSPKYLVDDSSYLYSVLDAFISLRASNKDIILGYANQQSLIYAAVGVNNIASGTFRNVRCFNPDIFDETEEDDESIKRRGIWYYDGNSLSEFRQQQLSLAYSRGLKKYFGPTCEYCENLLEASNPTSIVWHEPILFRHYLIELRKQWLNILDNAPQNRIHHIINLLNDVSVHNSDLQSKGFSLGKRGFNNDILDATKEALLAIKTDRKHDIALLS